MKEDIGESESLVPRRKGDFDRPRWLADEEVGGVDRDEIREVAMEFQEEQTHSCLSYTKSWSLD